MRRPALALTCLVAAPVLAAAQPPPRPDVLLVTVDTLRPDALGWVSGRAGTPALDALAREGYSFPAAVAPVPLTLPSHASLLSGLLPPRHGVRDNGEQLASEVPLLAERLRAAGYTTAAFVSGFPLSRTFGLDRGFDRYDDRLTAGEGAWLERPAAETTRAALAWLASARPPWFLWIHYYEPHYPYEPPAELALPGAAGAYAGEVALVDRAVGELLAGARGLAARPFLTVFAADHGESLGEHGEGTHGYFVYDSTVLVPLVFHFPGRVTADRGTATPRLVDVAPTVLALLDLPALAESDGISLAPLLLAREEPEIPPAYIETYQPWHSYGWSPLVGVRHGGWKWIAAPRRELYRLATDPAEAHNLAESEPSTALELDRLLRDFVRAAPAAARRVEDPETLERLAALGYVAGAAAERPVPGGGLPDPKERVALRDLLTEADELAAAGASQEALARFDEALAVEPENPFALSRSAAALLRLGRAQEAVARLRRAVAGAGDQPETRALLAEALGASGSHAEAAAEWMEVVSRVPRVPRYWSNLGAELGRAGRAAEAVEALERAWELEPESADRLVRLAFAEFAAGRLSDCARHLQEAAMRMGEGFSHAGALGIVLERTGQKAEALSWLARARPNEPEFAEARFALARLELASGNAEAARRALREAIAADPGMRAKAEADTGLRSLLGEL